RADLKAALAVEPKKRTDVQKYLADKLGPLVNVTPDETSKALNAEQRQKIDSIKQQIAAQNSSKRRYGKLQAAYEHDKLPATHVLLRGNHLTPGPEVEPGPFAVLTDDKSQQSIPSQSNFASSGRRTAWAKWLTRPDHPLTSRVFVNRVWQHYFGEG